MSQDPLPLDRRLRQETLFARERVYRFGKATPLERLALPLVPKFHLGTHWSAKFHFAHYGGGE